MAYKAIQSKNKPSEFNSGLPPVLYATLAAFLIGDNPMKRIPLTQGKSTLVDDEDFKELSKHKWCLLKGKYTWYAVRAICKNDKYKILYMHRVIMNAQKSQGIDHRNGDGLYNLRHNLRFCTQSQNNQNQRKTRGTSQYKGIYWNKRDKKWQTQIKLNGKGYFLGLFDDEIEAAKAYDKRAKELFGEFARLNFPIQGIQRPNQSPVE